MGGMKGGQSDHRAADADRHGPMTTRTITIQFPPSLFMPHDTLDVEEGKEVVVAIDEGASSDGTVRGLREAATVWAGFDNPEQVRRVICETPASGSMQAPELKRHAVTVAHGVGHRPLAQATMPLADGGRVLHDSIILGSGHQRAFRVGNQSPVRPYIPSCATKIDTDESGSCALGSCHSARQPARSSQGSSFRLPFHSRQQAVAHCLQVDRFRTGTGGDSRLPLTHTPMTL